MSTEQGIELRGQREQDSSKVVRKNSDTERTIQQGNLLAIINAFATLDAVLIEHLEKGAKNAKIASWQIQKYIIECLSEFVLSKIKDEIPDYYSIIADEATDRFSNKEILLLCLRYLRFRANEKPYPAKHFSIFCISKTDQKVRLLEAVFCYSFKETK